MENENEFLYLQKKCYAIVTLLLCPEPCLAWGQAHTAGHKYRKYLRWNSYVSSEAQERPLHCVFIFFGKQIL